MLQHHQHNLLRRTTAPSGGQLEGSMCVTHLFPRTWLHTVHLLLKLYPPQCESGRSPLWHVWTQAGRSEVGQSDTSEGGNEWNWPPHLGSLWWSWSLDHKFCWDTKGKQNNKVCLVQIFTPWKNFFVSTNYLVSSLTVYQCMSPSGG